MTKRLIWWGGWLACLISVFYFLPAWAEEAPRNIGAIKVEGNWTIETPTIYNCIKSQVGERLDPPKLRQDLESIYKTGFFEQVKIDVTEVEGQAQIAFIVREKPSIKEIEIVGYDELDLEKIKE